MKETTAACVAGGACVAGLSLSTVNVWLGTLSLVLSILAAVLALGKHLKEYFKNANRP